MCHTVQKSRDTVCCIRTCFFTGPRGFRGPAAVDEGAAPGSQLDTRQLQEDLQLLTVRLTCFTCRHNNWFMTHCNEVKVMTINYEVQLLSSVSLCQRPASPTTSSNAGLCWFNENRVMVALLSCRKLRDPSDGISQQE